MRLKTAVLAALLGATLLCGVTSAIAQTSTNPAESSPLSGRGISRTQDTQPISQVSPGGDRERRPEATSNEASFSVWGVQLQIETVQPGDSLSAIAERVGTTTERLFAKNTFLEHDCLIEVGQVLVIPDQVEQLAPRETAPCPMAPAVKSISPRGPPGTVVLVPGDDVWARLRQCESGGNYATNTGNTFYGAYQFDWGTWNARAVVQSAINADENQDGQPDHPEWANAANAPPWLQDAAARELHAARGWQPWPHCSRTLGLR